MADPLKKPLISTVNQKQRLDYGKKKIYANKDIHFRNNVLFSEESKLVVFGQKKHAKVWKIINCEYTDQILITTS